LSEDFGDRGGGGDGERAARETQTRVIVDEVHDLDSSVVFEPPVGDVGLPAFIRQSGFEADPRAARSFAGLWENEPAAFEDPPDRGDSRHRLVDQRQVIVDRLRAGVQAIIGKLLSPGDDLVLQR